MSDQVKVAVRSGDFGVVWLLGWMFTLGFLKLGLVKAAVALIVWPFYLGSALGR